MRRILLGALLVAAVWAAPASAQSLVETCGGTSSPVYGACRLGETSASNVSAACRRTADEQVDDSTCWTPISPRTSRRLVREYRGSWLHRTLDFQHELAGDVPFANAPWIGTHNSYNSASETATLSGMDHNQQLSLDDQLDIDVRSLELDVHWFWRADGTKAPVLCHARGADQMHAGCTSERLFDAGLAEIRGWLADHEDEVILLYVEDHLETQEGYDTAAAMLERELGSRIYRPAAGSCQKLPLTGLTRDDVLAAGKQVVVMSSCGDGTGTAWRGLVFDDAIRNEARPQGLGDGCGFSRDTYDNGFVRFFEDTTVVSANAQYVGQGEVDDGLTPEITEQLVRCGLDLSGFDQLLPDDGRLAAWAWSWDTGEPRASDDCAVQVDGGRWEGSSCGGARRFGCRTAGGDWFISRKAGPAKQGSDRCGDGGGDFTAPRTARENELLRRAADGATVWVGVRRSSAGGFVARG